MNQPGCAFSRPFGRFFYCSISALGHRIPRLAGCLISILVVAGVCAHATPPVPATTQITDVVYRADGSPAHGVLMITWPAFTSSSGFAVASGSMNVTLGANGALSLALIANEGATPSGTFYKVLLKLDKTSRVADFYLRQFDGNGLYSRFSTLLHVDQP
jgi:hypothetical protein